MSRGKSNSREQRPALPGTYLAQRLFQKRIVGGEVLLNVNAMNQYARAANFASVGGRQLDSLYGLYDVCSVYNRSDCLLRGIGGDYARGTVEASWKRKFIDPLGEVWTPFTFVRPSALRAATSRCRSPAA